MTPEEIKAEAEELGHEIAIEIVARRIAWNAVRGWPEWENYPEIGEDDWYAVLDHLDRLVSLPDDEPAKFRSAYALLSARGAEPTP